MFKKNKKIILISIAIIILVGIFVYGEIHTRSILSLENTDPSVLTDTSPSQERKDTNTDLKNTINVSFEILGQTYQSKVPENSSVYDLMNILKNDIENNFTFNYKEHPGMGVFINEINGVKGGDGGYWIYYINNKEASVGVSNYILKEGDSVLWKHE